MGSRGIAVLVLTSAPDGVGGKCHASASLPSEMTQYPLYMRLGGSPGRPDRVREVFSYRDSIPGPSSQ